MERRAYALRAAPIMSHDHEPSQTELIDQGDEIRNMVRERQCGAYTRVIGITGADPIGSNDAETSRCERVDEVAIEKAPGGITGQ